MSDLVMSLRDIDPYECPLSACELGDKAADRIEKLEAALTFYADMDAWDEYEDDKRAPEDRQFGSTLGSDKGEIARAALKQD